MTFTHWAEDHAPDSRAQYHHCIMRPWKLMHQVIGSVESQETYLILPVKIVPRSYASAQFHVQALVWYSVGSWYESFLWYTFLRSFVPRSV